MGDGYVRLCLCACVLSVWTYGTACARYLGKIGANDVKRESKTKRERFGECNMYAVPFSHDSMKFIKATNIE